METKDQEKHQEYCRIRNTVRQLSRNEEKKKEERIADSAKTNPKKFWNYVRRKTKSKKKIAI